MQLKPIANNVAYAKDEKHLSSKSARRLGLAPFANTASLLKRE